jgi:hypothetical protein
MHSGLSRLWRSSPILSMAAGPLLKKRGVLHDCDSFLWGDSATTKPGVAGSITAGPVRKSTLVMSYSVARGPCPEPVPCSVPGRVGHGSPRRRSCKPKSM